MLFLVTCHNGLPQPQHLPLFLDGDYILGGSLGHMRELLSFPGYLPYIYIYRSYTCYETSVCFLLLIFHWGRGQLSQEPRRVGEKLLFLPHTPNIKRFVCVSVLVLTIAFSKNKFKLNFLKLLTHILAMTGSKFHKFSLSLLKILPLLHSYFPPSCSFQTCERVVFTCHFYFLSSNFQFKNRNNLFFFFAFSNLLI